MKENTKIEFEIEGIVPILFDRYTDLPQPKNDNGYMKQAEEKVYRNEDGFICIPSNAIKACMKAAIDMIGKKMDRKTNKQLLSSQVFIPEQLLSVGKKEHDGIAKHIAVRGTGKKVTRVPTYRPFVKQWSVKGTLHSFGFPIDMMEECLTVGGQLYGLLGYRPEYGRFIVKKFKEVKNE